MSTDIVRQSDFGKDVGLVHEMIVTGRKVGAASDFYAALAHDEALFRRVVEMVCGNAKDNHLQAAAQALQAAVEKGVAFEKGMYWFYDPGISLVTLRDLPIVRQQKLVYQQDWYEQYDWAKREDAPQERMLRVPVEGSFGKAFSAQKELLPSDEEVSSVRSVATFLVINALVTGKRLLPNCWVRCIEVDSGGGRVGVGGFGSEGLGVDSSWDDYRHDDLGVSSARKK